jgi:hypothetical protein
MPKGTGSSNNDDYWSWPVIWWISDFEAWDHAQGTGDLMDFRSG